MRLFVARHGVTEWNRIHRFQGQSDVPLSEQGRAEARALAARLAAQAFDAVYASDLSRALETAAIVAAPHGVAVTADAAFREIALGALEGQTRDEVLAEHGEIYAGWRRDPASVRFPGGERLEEVQERMWQGFERLRAAHPHGTVLLVSHGYAILSLVCRVLELPLQSFRRLWMDTAGLTEIVSQGDRLWLRRMNDQGHVEAPALRRSPAPRAPSG